MLQIRCPLPSFKEPVVKLYQNPPAEAEGKVGDGLGPREVGAGAWMSQPAGMEVSKDHRHGGNEKLPGRQQDLISNREELIFSPMLVC